jgi:hypothetical protein
MRGAGAILIASAGLLLASSSLPLAPAGALPPTGPSHCRAKQLRAVVASYASALNRGDYDALDAIFAEKPDFQWYTTDGRIGAAAKRRDTLIPYFRRRHARGERLGLLRFRFTGNSPHYGNFEMTMRRSLPAESGGRWLPVPGKGAAVCAEGATRLIVISFGNAAGR